MATPCFIVELGMSNQRMEIMTIATDLQRIEQQLASEGDTPHVRTAFWRIVGKMKRQNPSRLTEAEIDRAAAIRNRLFKQPVILKVRTGLLLFFITALFAFFAFLWALFYFESSLAMIVSLPPGITAILLNITLGIFTIFIAYGIYPWGRFLGGLIAHVRFEGFYRYSPGELGLKIEYTSYLKTSQSRRKWVFGFPIPWVFAFIIILVPITWLLNPAGIWAPLIICILFVFFYLVIYRAKTGELYRFIRELRIAREVKQTQQKG